jgi:transcriptional regulator with XRE-family HTH domain
MKLTLEELNAQIGFQQSTLSKLISDVIVLRLDHGLTQQELARQMGTTQSVISRFENFGRSPSLEFLDRLAMALGGSLKISLNADRVIELPDSLAAELQVEARAHGKSLDELVLSRLRPSRSSWSIEPKVEITAKFATGGNGGGCLNIPGAPTYFPEAAV